MVESMKQNIPKYSSVSKCWFGSNMYNYKHCCEIFKTGNVAMNYLKPLRTVENYHGLHNKVGHQFSFVAKICVRAKFSVVTLNATHRCCALYVKGSATCCVRCGVLAVVNTKTMVFMYVAQCTLVEGWPCFRGRHFPYVQGAWHPKRLQSYYLGIFYMV